MPGDDELISGWLRDGNPAAVSIEADPHSAGIDAFGRVRVSQPVDIFDSQFEYDEQPLLWDSFITGSAATQHNHAFSSVELGVSGSFSVALRQSRGYFRYQPGKSQLINETFFHVPRADSLYRIGYYDDNDGIFLEHSGTAVSVVLRSSAAGSVSENRAPQAVWNLDRLDGSADGRNPSGYDLDIAQTQHLVIDTQWLGVGRARIGFFIGGVPHYVHEFNSANQQALPLMHTANLPLRSELRGLAAMGTPDEAQQICASISSEAGRTEERGKPFVASRRNISKAVATSFLPILSIRPAATFKGHVNRSEIVPTMVNVLADLADINWELLWGPIVSGSGWVQVDSESGVEYDVSGSTVYGGLRVATGYVSATAAGSAVNMSQKERIQSKLRLALDIAGAHRLSGYTDNLTLVAAAGTGTATVAASIEGLELR